MQESAMEFITAFSLGLVLLFILIRLFFTPIRMAFKLFINALAGGALLWFLNLLMGTADMNIGINPLTAAIAGVLGVPGIAMLLLLQIVLKT